MIKRGSVPIGVSAKLSLQKIKLGFEESNILLLIVSFAHPFLKKKNTCNGLGMLDELIQIHLLRLKTNEEE